MKTHDIEKDSTATVALRVPSWTNSGHKRIIGLALLLILLLVTLSASAFGQESCSLEEVKIGFQGKTCAFFDYEITLNGAVASGFGTQCVSFELFPNLTNKAWASLKVDQTYEMTAGFGLCITQINF